MSFVNPPGGGGGGGSGAAGKSAYELAVDQGFVGTLDEWLTSLTGPPGATGSGGTVSGRGAVCFVGDDSYAEHFTILGLIKARGGHGTIAYEADKLNVSGRLTSSQVQLLVADGHEVAWHSQTHVDMTSVSAASRAAQWDPCIASIVSVTGKAPVNAVYPYSARSDLIDHEAYARGFGRTFYGVQGLAVSDRKQPLPFSIGRLTLIPETMDEAREAIKACARNDWASVIYFHNIDGSGTVTTANLIELFNLCLSFGAPMTTLAEAFPQHQPLRNLKMDIPVASMYELTKTAGAAITTDSAAGSQPSGFAFATQGIKALKFVNAADSDDGLAALGTKLVAGTSIPDAIPCRGGEAWAMPTWVSYVKGGSTGSAKLEADEYDREGNVLRTDVLETLSSSTSGFARAGLTGVTTDKRCVRIRPRFHLVGQGTAYFFAPHPGHAKEVGAVEPAP